MPGSRHPRRPSPCDGGADDGLERHAPQHHGQLHRRTRRLPRSRVTVHFTDTSTTGQRHHRRLVLELRRRRRPPRSRTRTTPITLHGHLHGHAHGLEPDDRRERHGLKAECVQVTDIPPRSISTYSATQGSTTLTVVCTDRSQSEPDALAVDGCGRPEPQRDHGRPGRRPRSG